MPTSQALMIILRFDWNLFLFFFSFVPQTISLCSTGCSGTHKDQPVFAFGVLGLKVWPDMLNFKFSLKSFPTPKQSYYFFSPLVI